MTHRRATLLTLLLLAAACRDNDPLSPLVPPHRAIPKPARTLSGGLAVQGATDMDTTGKVIGSLYTGTSSHAAISVNGAAYDLGTIDQSSTTSTHAAAINNHGEVVGSETTGDGATYGFLWTPDSPNGTTGTMQRLPDSPSGPAQAFDINDAGQIVGTLVSGNGIVLWKLNESDKTVTVEDLPNPYSDGTISGRYINNFGQLAGERIDAAGTYHAFVWTPTVPNTSSGDFKILDGEGANYGWHAAGLNNNGQVLVGQYWSDGTLLWTPATPNATTFTSTALVGPYGGLTAVDINDRGDVLANGWGAYSWYCGETYHLYLWRPRVANTNVGGAIDVTPDLGGSDYYGYCYTYAYGSFLSEEEIPAGGSATVQAFGQIADWYYCGCTYDQVWTPTGVDAPLAARFSWNGYAYEGNEVYFDALLTEPYSPSLTFQWDFGDGTSATGSTASHTYADNGQYTGHLTVSDGSGNTSTTPLVANVYNLAPTGQLTATPNSVNEGGSYTLTLTNVRDVAADLSTVQLALDCGDGRGYQSITTSGSLTCSAPNEALRTARAQLRDKDGGVNEYTAPVTVLNVAPRLTSLSAPASITEKTTYNISFTFTDPGLLDTWGYTVDWGDGTYTGPISTSTQGGTASHRYQLQRRGGVKSQTFTVTVSVFDNAGGTTSSSTTVIVSGNGAH